MTRIRCDDIEFFYVNLASRPDRREHAEGQFAKHGLFAERFEAFTPDEWPGPEEAVARMRPTPGAIGCYQSQTHLIRLAKGSDRLICVCEDDVLFCEDFNTRLQYIEDNFDEDFDIFWLGATFHVKATLPPGEQLWTEKLWPGELGRDVELTPVKHILRTYCLWGTYSYIVNGRSVEKILKLFKDNVHRARGIDDLCMMLGRELKTFCFVPGMAFQIDGRTDIGVGGDGITRFSHFHKLGPYVFTERMEEFDPDKFELPVPKGI